jgi:hypothetical protein
MHHAMTFKEGDKELHISELRSGNTVKITSRFFWLVNNEQRAHTVDFVMNEEDLRELKRWVTKQLKAIEQPQHV